jgi:hypothetical protein
MRKAKLVKSTDTDKEYCARLIGSNTMIPKSSLIQDSLVASNSNHWNTGFGMKEVILSMQFANHYRK